MKKKMRGQTEKRSEEAATATVDAVETEARVAAGKYMGERESKREKKKMLINKRASGGGQLRRCSVGCGRREEDQETGSVLLLEWMDGSEWASKGKSESRRRRRRGRKNRLCVF